MRLKLASVSTVLVVLLLSSVSPCIAFFKSDVDKAKEFMEAGMYPQAIELLKNRINNKPTDAGAHFQLGICYINTGHYGSADERFGSAVRLEPDYAYKIGDEFREAGASGLKAGRFSQSQLLYRKAVQYQPNLKNKISTFAFSKGKSLFEQGQYDSADRTFSVAIIFDDSLRKHICDMYYNLGNAADDTQCFEFYRRTRKYCNAHNKKIGERIVVLAKSRGISKSQKQRYKQEASLYLTEAEIKRAFPPDYKIYGPGTHILLPLKAGEKSGRYIRITTHNYDISSSDNMFKLEFRDGDIIQAWSAGSIPNKNGSNADFKVIAVTDQLDLKLKTW